MKFHAMKFHQEMQSQCTLRRGAQCPTIGHFGQFRLSSQEGVKGLVNQLELTIFAPT